MPALDEYPYRMDIRLAPAPSQLDGGTPRDIDAGAATVLSPAAFGAFCKMLDEPMPPEARELLSRGPVWG